MGIFHNNLRQVLFASAFPSIKKLTMPQRKKWYLFGNGFSFDDCNEVFHVEQILGNSENYRHERNGTSSQSVLVISSYCNS